VVKPQVSMLCSHISHMALGFVWRDAGVTQQHGFELTVHIVNWSLNGEPKIGWSGRAPAVLDGTYDFLSGLHHETYIYRAKGDKRLMYLAQAQNDWDDRIVAAPDVRTARDLEGKRFLVTSFAPCVYGNLRHSLLAAGADLERIEFVDIERGHDNSLGWAVEEVARGNAAAASVDLPFDRRGEKLGLQRLDVPSVPVIHNCTICANREWVVENEETTLAFLRSMVDAIHFFKTEKDRTCAILERELAPLLGLQGADEIDHLYEGWARLLSPKPYPHPLAVWNVYNLDVAHDPAVNFIGPFEIWDTSYLRTVDDAGYIDELYGGATAAANPAVTASIHEANAPRVRH
jgi:hypothetical protein